PMPDGREIALYAGGPGGDLRVGVGLTDWLALDLQLFGETLLLAGDARAGALFELAPSAHFAIAAGGGVGSMYLANFFFHSPSADFGAVVLRLEGRVEDEDGSSPEGRLDLVFGAEGDLGFVFAGSLPPGAWLLGGRAFAGLLWH
ncbi:MAG: hypothetical protein IT373_04115, partial [Polyangiaceae bacterium]|nr:hypothetical protein [Polyangiaceae bacterium]